MDKRDDGGPAFPTWDKNHAQDAGGMTLRDYFASKAMAALLGGKQWTDMVAAGHSGDKILSAFASASYGAADYMLRERAK